MSNQQTLSAVNQVLGVILEGGVWKAVKYLSPTQIVRATVIGRKFTKGQKVNIQLTIGRPNYKERDFIADCKKAKQPFPIKYPVLQYPPKPNGKKRA